MVIKSIGSKWRAAAAVFATALSAPAAYAGMGFPSPWQKGMQEPATEIAKQINDFHSLLLWVITAITVFVMALLLAVMVRFNEKANPKPSKTSHNTAIEVAWTLIPILILLVIAVPSFRILFKQYEFPKADLTIKAIGHQWYWTHEYPDLGNVTFDSLLLEGKDFDEAEKKGLKPIRLLSVDNEVVVPAGKVVHILGTADDVIHSWSVPSFGANTDVVPGRTTATWFKVDKPGVYYGACTQLCGTKHAYMPIAVRVVSPDVFNEWAAALKVKDKTKARAIIEKAALEQAGTQVAVAPAPK